ncbi:GntR family transcriptional regulator [Frondihabitans sucicola]|uniref:GntR family transcriptional regulator n=1 Tax=Frondihabitans sucicola TaxID=1268041 RepID=A0ABM8GS33_9MICO|nr:GntR family transcriptional regulator [Frondihabitans sucicola]BDZ51263.1 GntR family transcriptional regulator [Frondihabitans sucicola]
MPLDTSRSQTHQVYESLRAAILSLDVAPGERLSERGLETTYGASRTPARAALMRLESEGLVRREGRGWIVTPIDLAEIHAISEMRAAVESAAVRYAVARAGSDDIEALRELLEADRPRDDETGHRTEELGVRAGTSFHAELTRLSGNAVMAQSVHDSLIRLERTRWLEVRTPEARATAWRDHLAILDAIARRDADGAADLVASHIHGTNERLITALTAERRRFRGNGLAIVGDVPTPADPFLPTKAER